MEQTHMEHGIGSQFRLCAVGDFEGCHSENVFKMVCLENSKLQGQVL